MTDLAVIMSVYNKDRLKFIAQSVKSILDQTFTFFHFFIVFDGPVGPETEDFFLSDHDPRIRIFKLEKNSGLATALNFLLEYVLKNPDYKFIARMDADDLSLPSRLEKQRSFLISHPEISIVGTWYEVIDENGERLSVHKLPTNHEDLLKRFLTRTPFAHSSVMFSRRLIEMAGLYPTNTMLMEDNVLWGRAFKAKLRFSNLAEILHCFRIGEDYYKRRSGLKYGTKYFITRLTEGKGLFSPFKLFPVTLLLSVPRMLPYRIFKLIYKLSRPS